MTTPKLQMPELVVGQAGKELTHNQALAVLDQLAQAVVVDKDLTAPPGSPANGSMYIVAAGATGAWSGMSGKLAYWLTTVSAWTFITPADGWSVWVTDEAKRYELLAGVWTIVAAAGGGSGDMLSTLISSEVSVTGAATLTSGAFGKMHLCSGTTADYTVSLPASSGSAGKVIGFRMASGLTKMVSIDASGSELIDGQLSRVMWANEAAILLCDGVGWSKIAGKSIPMYASAYPTGAITATSVQALITLDAVVSDQAGMADLSTNRINIKRPGIYRVTANIYYNSGAGTSAGLQILLDKSASAGATGTFTEWRTIASTEFVRVIFDGAVPYASGDYITMYGAVLTGASRPVLVNDPTWTLISVTEIPTW